jgi:hypothetical protein
MIIMHYYHHALLPGRTGGPLYHITGSERGAEKQQAPNGLLVFFWKQAS